EGLRGVVAALEDIARDIPVLFPVHPRTRQRLQQIGLDAAEGCRRPIRGRLQLVEPLGYIDFLALVRHATLVITDSGGIQEETTYLRVPCLTVRENTERPVTVTLGTNTLIGRDMTRLCTEVGCVLAGTGRKGNVPPLWDGQASERIANVVLGT